MNGYWSWWAGALGLGGVAIGHYIFLGTTFGVSGAMERLLFWKQERAVEKADAMLDEFDFDAALAAATAEAFAGQQSVGGSTAGSISTIDRAMADISTGGPAATPTAEAEPKSTPVGSQAVFVAFLFIGGLIAAITSGKFKIRMDMGPAYANIVTNDWKMWPMLFIGGVLAGFGTRLCGGCSSGHGLNGCSRLQPISILATSVFFGTAVVVSTLLLKVF